MNFSISGFVCINNILEITFINFVCIHKNIILNANNSRCKLPSSILKNSLLYKQYAEYGQDLII